MFARLEPITAALVFKESERKVPDFREKFWILIKSGVVPTTVAEGTELSPERALTEIARGATDSIFSRFLMVFTSSRVKFDFK